MSEKLRSKAITALLIRSTYEDEKRQRKTALANRLALEVLNVTQDVEQAKLLLDSERKKIASRGEIEEYYLLGNDVTVREVLKTYYAEVGRDFHGNRILSSQLTISEMMLMLGVFCLLEEERHLQSQRISKEIQKIRYRLFGRGYSTGKRLSKEEIAYLMDYKNILHSRKVAENKMIQYLQSQNKVVTDAILRILGTSMEEAKTVDLMRLVSASGHLCLTSKPIRIFLDMRRNTVEDDIAYFQKMGESCENLEYILEEKPTRSFQYIMQEGTK